MSAQGNVPAQRPGQRAGRAIVFTIAGFVIAAAGFASGWLIGGRRTIMTATSPTRDAVAFVYEGRCAAGFCQALYVGSNLRTARSLETLSGDAERADQIVWTPDGGRVAFLVNGYQLRIFDAHTGANLGAVNLVEPDGSPSTRIARGVTFSSNGAAVTFDDCARSHSGCRPGLTALKLP